MRRHIRGLSDRVRWQGRGGGEKERREERKRERERELLYKKKRIIPNVCLRINVNRCGIQACNLGGSGET